MGRMPLVAGCCLLLGVLAAGCATTGGVQVAGAAAQVTPPPVTTPLPKGTPPSDDAVAVLRADPKVNTKIKSMLVPCADGHYPVDERYTDLTGDGVADLIITVGDCPSTKADIVVPRALAGYAAYVYTIRTRPAVRIFGDEAGGVALLPEPGRGLGVLHDRYQVTDEPCCPTDQTYTLYRWNGAKFVEARK